MDRTVVIVTSPRSLISGAFPDMLRTLALIGMRSLILTGSASQVRVKLPPNTSSVEVCLSKAMFKWFGRTKGLFAYLLEQLLVTLSLVKLSKKSEFVLFSHTLMPLPSLVLRLLGKKSMIYVGGIPHLGVTRRRFVVWGLRFLEDLYCRSANVILVVSMSLTKEYPLTKYQGKSFEAPIRLLDDHFFERFHFSPPSSKENVVGFVGRFSWEKGIMEFVDSIALIIPARTDIKFLIIGSGPLKYLVLRKVSPYRVRKRVVILPWINDIWRYLNKVKLLIIPSRTEGLPSVMLEAMACGAIVLATPVGGVKDLIRNGRNGFLLGGLQATHICSKILEILGKQGSSLDQVSHNAERILRKKYAKGIVVEKWRRSIEAIAGA